MQKPESVNPCKSVSPFTTSGVFSRYKRERQTGEFRMAHMLLPQTIDFCANDLAPTIGFRLSAALGPGEATESALWIRSR